MKLSTKIILPIILISALLILLNGCFGVPVDESPGYTPGTITGIIASPCCSTSAESVSETCCIAPEYWCFYCQKTWNLQDGIEVVLTYGEDEVATVFTNKDGEFTFTNVDPGKNYVVTAYCPDFDDNRPLIKDVALEVVEGGSFDTDITDLVSTSLGLVVDFLVLYTEWGPEDISLDEVLADRPSFPSFPKFKKLVYEVRRVVENCEVNLLTDDEVQDALCFASEEVGRETDPDLVIGCSPGYTPPPPPPPPPIVTYVLTTAADPTAGGTVSGAGTYNSGTVVPVAATPTTGWTFTGWTGDLSGTTNPTSITMNSNKSVVAHFTEEDLCADNTAPVVDKVEYDDGTGFKEVHDRDTINVIVGQSYTVRVTATDDGTKDPLTFQPFLDGVGLDTYTYSINKEFTIPTVVGDIGTHTVYIEFYDGCTTTKSGTVTVIVHDECYLNLAPVITLPAGSPFAIDPNTLKTWSFTVTDDDIKPGALSVTASISPAPNTPGNFDYTFNYTTKEGTITWTPECEDIGQAYTITVGADDGCVLVDDSFGVTLNTEPCACFDNADPVITLPAGSPFAIDPNTLKTWSFTVTDDDIKPGALSVTASISPAPNTPGNFDYTFNYTTKEGTITWTPECEDIGQAYTITVGADDGCVLVDDSFGVTLNTEPCACFDNADPVITLPAGSPFAIDPNTLKTWSFTVTDDDIKPGALSVTASISPAPNTPGNFDYTFNYTTKEGTITWTPECEDIGQAYTITVGADDGCVLVDDSFGVTLNTEPCACFDNVAPIVEIPDDSLGIFVAAGSAYDADIFMSDVDLIKDPLTYTILISPLPVTNSLVITPITGGVHISWDTDCADIVDGVNTEYTITVEAFDGCDTTIKSFIVTLLAEPCVPCSLSLQVKEGGELVEYLDGLPFTTTESGNVTTVIYDDIFVETKASKLWFRICASPDAEMAYNFYRGGSCPNEWISDDGSAGTPPGWIALDSKFNTQYYPDGYPKPSPDDLIICNTGDDPNEPVNILMVKVAEGGLETIYIFNIFR